MCVCCRREGPGSSGQGGGGGQKLAEGEKRTSAFRFLTRSHGTVKFFVVGGQRHRTEEPIHTDTMAKSSKKQCRTPKPSRKGGGLVVVSQRNLHSNSTPQQHPQAKKGRLGKKGKKRGLGLADLIAPGDGDDSDDFDAPPSASVASTGGVAEYVFSSKHHSREQQLYYLLTTRTSELCATRQQQQQQQSGEGGGIPDAPTAVEGGCHALVFVETIAVAQELVGELKALSLVAFAVHDRTPKAQVGRRQQFKCVVLVVVKLQRVHPTSEGAVLVLLYRRHELT